VRLWRFLLGLATVLLAVAPAMEQLAHRSFAGHMVQHLLLTLVASPLIGTARPVATLWRGSGGAPRPGPVVAAPAAALVLLAGTLHLATMLLWHLPPLYDAAVASAPLHRVEHATLLGTAVLAWAAVGAATQHGDGAALAAVAALAVNALAGAGLGVVLLAAPLPLYDAHAAFGSGAFDAQRLGGALMKVGSSPCKAGAAVLIAASWIGRTEADQHAVVAGSAVRP
jgi:putative membrane protein